MVGRAGEAGALTRWLAASRARVGDGGLSGEVGGRFAQQGGLGACPDELLDRCRVTVLIPR